ncbi:M20/M25/M40 family metallo-hydrolase [Teichococcus aestuarii]|uniref:M20/M25/M40 family metallo-hydrolase n=1 Tax=Teichococcus aestuarii TaxID=568898 RepID=UPI00360F9B57
MPWHEQTSFDSGDDLAIDRLSLAAPLLGATGWIDGLARLVGLDLSVGEAPSARTALAHTALAQTLQEMFAPLGFNLRRIAPPGEARGDEAAQTEPAPASLVAARRTGRPVCSIHMPLSVAAPDPRWTRPPHALTRRGSQLFGCGTRGGQGAIAAVWAALRAADAVGLPLRFDPVLLFTPHDDSGAVLRHLCEQGEVRGHFLSLGGMAAPRIWAGALGLLTVELRIDGAADAEAALPVLARLAELQHQVSQRLSTLPAALEGEGIQLSAQLSVASVSMSPDGGIRRRCTVVVQRRFTPEEGAEAALEELRAAMAGLEVPGCALECRMVRHLPAALAPEEGPHGARWQRALSWGFGFAPDGFRRASSLEGSAFGFVQQAGVQEILVGGLTRPGQRQEAVNEFTTVEDVEALGRAVLAYLADAPEQPLDGF